MTTDTHEAKDVVKRLWAEIDHARLGMLGIISGPPRHFQPMTPFTVPEAGEIWFFTRADTDLAADASRGPSQAMFVVQAKDREIQACIAGELVVESDRARVDA
jgi:general stress protein 26